MKKVLIINNAYYDIDSYLYQSNRLKTELEKLGATVVVRKNDFFASIIDGEKIVNFCRDYDFCVYLDKDKYISSMLEKSGLKLFNSHLAMVTCDDKMATYIALSGCGIRVPKTLPGLLCYTKNAKVSSSTLDIVERELTYPIIVKQSFGSLGKGVYKADNRQELQILAEKVMLTPHHFQECVSSSIGRDARVIVIGKKVVCAMERKSTVDFRSNIELGGVGVKMQLNDKFVSVCEKVATVLDLDYCGIDLLFGKNGEPIVCEVNSNAFFGGIEKVTGVNVAEIYAKYLLNTR